MLPERQSEIGLKKKKDLAKNQETLYYKSKDNRTLGMMTTMNQPAT